MGDFQSPHGQRTECRGRAVRPRRPVHDSIAWCKSPVITRRELSFRPSQAWGIPVCRQAHRSRRLSSEVEIPGQGSLADGAEREEHTLSITQHEAAGRLLRRAPEILSRWEGLVRRKIPASRAQQPLALQAYLVQLLVEVASALSPPDQPRPTIEGPTLSQDHGGERALLAATCPTTRASSLLAGDQLWHRAGSPLAKVTRVISSDIMEMRVPGPTARVSGLGRHR